MADIFKSADYARAALDKQHMKRLQEKWDELVDENWWTPARIARYKNSTTLDRHAPTGQIFHLKNFRVVCDTKQNERYTLE